LIRAGVHVHIRAAEGRGLGEIVGFLPIASTLFVLFASAQTVGAMAIRMLARVFAPDA
jgi:hypothetical protein